LNLVLGDPVDAILVAETEALHVHGLDDAGDGQEPVVSNQWMIASQVVLPVHHSQILLEATGSDAPIPGRRADSRWQERAAKVLRSG
jgi:hypothetical protein